ncbi:sulfatase family protein [Oceaniferula spumae]
MIRLTALLFAVLLGIGQIMADQRKPNIVVILTDDLGYGDVSFLNAASKIKTPHMDALAGEGVYLTDAHSPSAICSPTRYSMLTGRYAWRNPILKKGVLMPWEEPAIGADEVTISAILKKSGYDTACIGKWHLGFHWPWAPGFSPKAARKGGNSIAKNRMFDWSKSITGGPLAVGFDYYFGDDVPNFPPYAFIENGRLTCDPVDIRANNLKPISFRGHIHGDGPGEKDWQLEKVMPTITERAVKYINEAGAKEKPFFLWFATTSPHTPVVPTKEFQGKSDAGYYGDFVVQTDHSVGKIVQALKKNGLFENTLLIVTSDNGPSEIVQGIIQKHGHLPAGELRGMKWDSWEGGHRVPFIASWPEGGVKGGKRVDEPILLTDLYATMGAVAGAKIADLKDSMNVMNTLLGKGAVRTELVYHSGGGHLGLRQNEWVLLQGSGGKKEPAWKRKRFEIQSPDAPVQLFNLSEDVTQKVNVASKHPEIVQRLSARLKVIKQSGR